MQPLYSCMILFDPSHGDVMQDLKLDPLDLNILAKSFGMRDVTDTCLITRLIRRCLAT